MTTTLDIGLDIDHVLYPFPTVFARWTERSKGLQPGTLDDHALTWKWYGPQWGMSSDEWLDHFTAGVLAGVIFAQGDPTPGSVAAVRRLHLAGHRLHYVTNRAVDGVSEEHAWQVTHRWLHEHGFVVDSLTISEDKASVDTDVFLDDAPHNIEALLDAGHRYPLLWDRPHNQGHRFAGRQPVRVHDWHAFERVIDGIVWWGPIRESTLAGEDACPYPKDIAA